jgi:hypothetical protein
MVGAERLQAPGLAGQSFDSLLEEAVRFHGRECPGQVLGVRMVLAGCHAIGVDEPRGAGKDLVLDYGKLGATFVHVPKDLRSSSADGWFVPTVPDVVPTVVVPRSEARHSDSRSVS